MPSEPKPSDPVQLVASLVRHIPGGERYTIARASIAIQDGETASNAAKKLREATVRDLRRSNREEEAAFFDGAGSMVESEAIFAIGESRAGRGMRVVHNIDGDPVPGARFKSMRNGEERLVFVDIVVITREEQAKTRTFIENLAA